jgi:DNA helicase-2/ATP-dependent DNA helicase PcrA
MALATVDKVNDRVASVEHLEANGAVVIDLDVEPTHNFIANGIVTHNSIYRFRGAEVGNMNEFVRDFGIKEVVKLEQNYRSQGNILDAANAIIAQNKARLGKNLWTSEGKGEQLRDLRARERRRGGALRRGRGEERSIARAWRSPRWRSSIARTPSRASSSTRSSAPGSATGLRGLRFFERQEIKHAMAYLRLAGNPDDDTAFTRVVNFPPRGIGARSIEQLQEAGERGMGSLMHVAAGGRRRRTQRHFDCGVRGDH